MVLLESASSRRQDPGPALLCEQLGGPRELPQRFRRVASVKGLGLSTSWAGVVLGF